MTDPCTCQTCTDRSEFNAFEVRLLGVPQNVDPRTATAILDGEYGVHFNGRDFVEQGEKRLETETGEYQFTFCLAEGEMRRDGESSRPTVVETESSLTARLHDPDERVWLYNT